MESAKHHAQAIFCENIQYNSTGDKLVMTGVMASQCLELPTTPYKLPELWLACWVFVPFDQPVKYVHIQVSGYPLGEKSPITLQLDDDFMELSGPRNSDGIRALLTHNCSDLVFERSGIVEILVETDRFTLVAGRLHILSKL